MSTAATCSYTIAPGFTLLYPLNVDDPTKTGSDKKFCAQLYDKLNLIGKLLLIIMVYIKVFQTKSQVNVLDNMVYEF